MEQCKGILNWKYSASKVKVALSSHAFKQMEKGQGPIFCKNENKPDGGQGGH